MNGKTVAICLAALAACAACGDDGAIEPEPPPGPPEAITVMTFNVLCSFCDGTYDPWDDRLGYFEDLFARHDPDLLGLQEIAFESEVAQVQARLPDHEAIYFIHPDNGIAYPDATVLFRRSRFEAIESGEYWLSPTPEVPSSTGFAEQQLPRLVVWVELCDLRTGRHLYFATTHFDNNAPSQDMSAPLLLERTDPWQARLPVVVVGDFNSQTYDDAYRVLVEGAAGHPGLTNAQDLAASWDVTHNQPDEPAYDLAERIDHLFVGPDDPDWTVDSWTVDLTTYGPSSLYPSDHRAMITRLTAPAR